MTEAVNVLATLGSLAAGRGQFRWRRWSVAVAVVGRRLAFCTSGGDDWVLMGLAMPQVITTSSDAMGLVVVAGGYSPP